MHVSQLAVSINSSLNLGKFVYTKYLLSVESISIRNIRPTLNDQIVNIQYTQIYPEIANSFMNNAVNLYNNGCSHKQYQRELTIYCSYPTQHEQCCINNHLHKKSSSKTTIYINNHLRRRLFMEIIIFENDYLWE